MQPRLYGAHRNTYKILNFLQFIALGIVQEHDQAVFVAELPERAVQLLHFLEAFVIERRIFVAGQAFEAIARERTLLDGVQALAREAALLIDEQIVHNATEPRPGLLDFHEVIDLAVGLDEEFLEQVLGLGLAAGQSPGEPIQTVEMWPDKTFERVAMLSDGWLLLAVTAAPTIR